MKKEALSIMIIKTLLGVIIFAGMGIIIIGGVYIIGSYHNAGVDKKITKPVDQETENHYNVLEKKCAGNSCCVSSLKTMKENNYKEADESGECPEGFYMDMMKCITSYQWCVPMEEIDWRDCEQDSDCVETQADCCSCSNGGKQTGINKKYLKSWEDSLKDKCQDIGCIALFNCKEGEVVCKDNKCEFQKETDNNDQFDTSDWQTYRNEGLGFEMRYPENWFVYERSDQKRVYIQTTEGHVSKATMQSDFKRIWIGYSFDELSERNEDYLKEYPGIKKYSIKNGEILMNVYEYKSIDSGEIVITAYWTKDNNNYLAASAVEVGQKNAKEQVVILKQILSTFKFIEK